MTNFNEQTNTFLYKNISLTLYSWRGDVGCVWEMSWRWGQTAILTPSSSSTIAALLPHLGSVAQPWVTSASWFSRWHSLFNWLEPSQEPGYIIVSRPPASAVLPLIYTGVSLDWQLGRGSIYNRKWKLFPTVQDRFLVSTERLF